MRNRLAVRDQTDRHREEAERRRASRRAAAEGKGSIFDTAPPGGVPELEVVEEARAVALGRPARIRKVVQRPKKVWKESTGKTAVFKISHRKLNKLAQQIGGKPIDTAILQMQFSSKRAATRIKSMLALARGQAEDKGLRRERMVVAEAWVNKGPKLMRMDIKGRGRFGVKHHPSARMCVVLKEGKTREEKKEAKLRKRIGLVRSAGLYRENVPIRNAGPVYAW
ncbi:ribosomal protein L22 [Calocera viscosa TUFC12733]|uniref:Ribosomal protein L22 n=1 Tax=Calocera viscosa (strain TUFC12733) TaxID=1330018 RepID=A0A167QS77_CALVF|nr:ribosomal protein L22 [Calocera viscosa TUFC12733]